MNVLTLHSRIFVVNDFEAYFSKIELHEREVAPEQRTVGNQLPTVQRFFCHRRCEVSHREPLLDGMTLVRLPVHGNYWVDQELVRDGT